MKLWIFLIALWSSAVFCSELDSYEYDNNLDDNGSTERDKLTSNVYVLPAQIFNDGKPFYVKKDPVNGALNFSTKTTPTESFNDKNATVTSNDAVDDKNSTAKHDISLGTSSVRTQNIHDYLNLPVKYSSSKFVYPLVSSSYANLKYQGNNKNFISNHKYDSSTLKVNSDGNGYTPKKYKTTYPTKTYYTSTTPKKVSTATSANTFETSTKSIQEKKNQQKKPFINEYDASAIASRPSYTTIGLVDRFNRTISPTSPTATTVKYSVTSLVTTIAPKVSSTVITNKNATNSEKEADSMNISDIFNYFFDTEENEETAGTVTATSTTVMRPTEGVSRTSTVRPTSTVTKSIEWSKNPIIITTSRVEPSPTTTFAPITRPSSPSSRLPIPQTTISAIFSSLPPSTPYLKTEVQSQSPIVQKRPQNIGAFQPPSANDMQNILVAPGLHTATFLATSQLTTGNQFDRRPVAGAHYRPQENVSNIQHSVVTSDKNVSPSNVLIQRANITNENDIQKTMNDINVYNSVGLSTQRPHGFSLPSVVTPAQVNFVTPEQTSASFETTTQSNVPVQQGLSVQQQFHQQQQLQAQQAILLQQSQIVPEIPPQFIQRYPQQQFIQQSELIQQNQQNQLAQQNQLVQQQQNHQLLQITQPTTSEPQAPIDITNVLHNIRFPVDTIESSSPVASTLQQQQQQNNSVKFPIDIQSQNLPNPGIPIKFNTENRNEIYAGINRNNYKQILKQQYNQNRVVFERPNFPQSHQQFPNGGNNPANIRPPMYNFKKPPGVQYPRKNLTLPNILPQFRPNTQLNIPQINPNKDLQIPPHFNRPIPAQQKVFNGQHMRYKPPVHFAYNMRTKAPVLVSMPADPHNRRHFDVHPANINQFNKRIYDRYQPQTLMHRYMERNVASIVPQPVSPNLTMSPEQQINDQQFDESAKVVNAVAINPETANYENKFLSVKPIESKETPKVEPVTTLQQIQQHRLLQKQNVGESLNPSVDPNVPVEEDKIDKGHDLYVVYPMKDGSLNADEKAANLPDTPTTIHQLGLPHAVQKTSRLILNNQPPLTLDDKQDGLYEKPDIAAEEEENDEIGEEPIAIAYSPTESNRPSHSYDTYNDRIGQGSAAATAAIHNGHDAHGKNDEHGTNEFMAPFFPSVNLENTKSTRNGWSIVTPPTIQSRNDVENNDKISALLLNKNLNETKSENRTDESTETHIETTTRKFDINNFQPELQGGFRPIFTSPEASVVPVAEKKSDNIDALVYESKKTHVGSDDDEEDDEYDELEEVEADEE